METKSKEYKARGEMDKDIKRMLEKGWEVLSLNTQSNGYGCLKTAGCGCLFLPLALLGKKPDSFVVTYKKVK